MPKHISLRFDVNSNIFLRMMSDATLERSMKDVIQNLLLPTVLIHI